jgi:hypothetical protein
MGRIEQAIYRSSWNKSCEEWLWGRERRVTKTSCFFDDTCFRVRCFNTMWSTLARVSGFGKHESLLTRNREFIFLCNGETLFLINKTKITTGKRISETETEVSKMLGGIFRYFHKEPM